MQCVPVMKIALNLKQKEDKRSIQLDITPYVGVIQYNVPSGSPIGLYSSPELSYLAGVTLAISNRRWMSSLSGCFDVSFSPHNILCKIIE